MKLPAMQQFDLGRFDEDAMAYPPSVVVKDYTWNNSPGYLARRRHDRKAVQDDHPDRPTSSGSVRLEITKFWGFGDFGDLGFPELYRLLGQP